MTDLTRLFSGDHPFITDPGDWIVVGHGMARDDLVKVPMEGRFRIEHSEGKVVNDGVMSIVSPTEPVTFKTRYELSPTDHRSRLAFFQVNSEVGDLAGDVIAFEDRIISAYRSGDGQIVGSEVLLKLGDNRYTATGTLLRNGELVNMWKLDLVRQQIAAVNDRSAEGKEKEG